MVTQRGQSTLEYCVMVIILIGALIAMSVYFKRGIQGRWRTAVDDLGDQYDPRVTNTDIIQHLGMNSQTRITTIPGQGPDGAAGIWTLRDEGANTTEIKTGSSTVGGF